MNPIEKLHQLGQSIWYDNIERRLITTGALEGMVMRGEIRGITSNPSIFNNAISNSRDYDQELIPLAKEGKTKEEIYEALVIADIRAACDIFLPLYFKSFGADGYVSFEVNPYLASNTDETLTEAERLWNLINRPNLMVKIPATVEGLPAITQAIRKGININVTLIFSIERYKKVIDAYMQGLDQRLQADERIDQIASVASFFVSRIDTNIDKRLLDMVDNGNLSLNRARELLGKIAIASAKLAYDFHKQVFSSARFKDLQKQGGRIQRPLWASTSTKNSRYPDTMYVDQLIGPNTINTVPPSTLVAFRNHGCVTLTLESDLEVSKKVLRDLDALGISLQEVTQELEVQGVRTFSDAFATLLDSIERRRLESLNMKPAK